MIFRVALLKDTEAELVAIRLHQVEYGLNHIIIWAYIVNIYE